jgi:hypothetical protein
LKSTRNKKLIKVLKKKTNEGWVKVVKKCKAPKVKNTHYIPTLGLGLLGPPNPPIIFFVFFFLCVGVVVLEVVVTSGFPHTFSLN